MRLARGFGVSTDVVGTPQVVTLAQLQALSTPLNQNQMSVMPYSAPAPQALTTPLVIPAQPIPIAQAPAPASQALVTPSPLIDPSLVPVAMQAAIATSESVPLTSTTDLAARIQDQGLTPTGPFVATIPPPPTPPAQNMAPYLMGGALLYFLLARH
jgi:hypothetical protein